MYQVDLNLLVGVMTFTFSPLHCFYATIVEGGAADWRRRPILVYYKNTWFTYILAPTRPYLPAVPYTMVVRAV